MAQASIPVDLFNPGQVFACMGFLEAADVLLGQAQGGFAWANESDVRFRLCADGSENPFETILDFLAGAEIERLVPKSAGNAIDNLEDGSRVCVVETFPASDVDPKALPLRFTKNGRELYITHWCDESSRNSFKLFAGQHSAAPPLPRRCWK
ncbi:MAG TPA: hypothetical protein VNJ11_06325 [Bryobacteraceae bacterium]|nr:hypothetical protein [Bryobacteraceae bacterium]